VSITANNQVRIGNTNVLSIGGYAGWTTLPSDKRFKKNIVENVPGLTFILKLRPITYNIDMDAMAKYLQTPYGMQMKDFDNSKGSMLQTGFVAQEVESAANEIGFDFCGIDKPKNKDDFYGIRYAEFTVPLVKAVQELSAQLDAQRKLNEEQKTINELLVKKIEELDKKLSDLDLIRPMER
jgi:hypothetical protein